MSDRVEQAFANLRRGPWNASPLGVPQEGPPGNGNIDSQGWLADGSVTADVIQANAVIAGKVDADAITAREIAANTITAAEIAANTITANEIAANAITASELAANSVVAGKIAANTITATEIAADSITTSELAANAVITENVLAANITSSRIELTISGKNFGANTGSAGAPGVFFDGASNYGLYFIDNISPIPDWVAITVAGSKVVHFLPGGISVVGNIDPGNDNAYSLGASGLRYTEVWAVDGSINTSDERLKRDIADAPLGLDFVKSVPPRVYRWRDAPAANRVPAAPVDESAKRACRDTIAAVRDLQLSGRMSDDEGEDIVAAARQWLNEIGFDAARPILEAQQKRRPGRRLHYGFIAQEVKAALDRSGIDPEDAAFWVDDEHGQSLRYTELIPILWRAVQEIAAENNDLRSRVAALEHR